MNAQRPRRNPLHNQAPDDPLHSLAAAQKQPNDEITTNDTGTDCGILAMPNRFPD